MNKFVAFMNSDKAKKITNGAAIVFAVVGAVMSTVGEQKREKEFEDMKKAIAELQSK